MSAVAAHLDTETRSTVDLKKAGLHRYFQDVTTEAMCFAWCVGDGDIFGQHNSDPSEPAALLDHIENGGLVTAHNAAFDRHCWNQKILKRHPTWPRLRIEQMSCTMARAQALSLPGSLAQLGDVLWIPMPKDLDGHRLMMKLCKPRGFNADGSPVWWGTPEEFDRQLEYCKRDVGAERFVDKKLPQLTESEHAVWVLDQIINDRGVRIDRHSVEAALRVVTEALRRADDEIWKLTDGSVRHVTQTKKLLEWLHSKGIPAESVAKSEEEEIVLMSDVASEPNVKAAVQLRNLSAKSSTAKLQAMLDTRCADDRVRGVLHYHGASTGRWAGRLIQPQNFPRVDADRDGEDIEFVLETLRRGWRDDEACDAIEMMTGNVMATMAKCLRTMLVAAPGKKFVGGDYSNIEGRIAAWIAGEEWKVDAFRKFDKGEGPDLYYVTAASILSKPITAISKTERQAYGKVPELALGYQGGVGAFQTMAKTYGVKVTDGEANKIKLRWRDAHPGIVDAWQELIDGAFAATENPGMVVDVLGGKCRFVSNKTFLYLKLPSKRVLAYSFPHTKWEERKDKATGEVVTDQSGKAKVDKVLYCYGVDSQKKKWALQKLYGGLLFENVVSGTARDILVEGMHRLEAFDYPIVLTIHDEDLSEVDEDFGSAEEYKSIMEILPQWAKGLPVAASTWEGARYEK